MTTHTLKIWPEWFNLVIMRTKEFEIRKADRPFQPGDTLRLREYEPTCGTYTGRVAVARVTCVLSNMPGLLPGYVAMGAFFQHIESAKHAQAEDSNNE